MTRSGAVSRFRLMKTDRTVALWAALAALAGVAAVVALWGGAVSGVSGSLTSTPGTPRTANQAPRPAPDFALPDVITTDSLSLSDLAGSPALLFFFDAGSMHSAAAIPYVNEWHRRYQGDGLKVLGIHSSEFEPMKLRDNVLESSYRQKISFPFCMDPEGTARAAYSLTILPSYVLLNERGEIVLETSAAKPYVDVEKAIQQMLAADRPDMKNPFLVKPLRPIDDPTKRILLGTPEVVLGYLSGKIVGCDSAARDTFYNYIDPGGRERGKVYLQGYWKVEPGSVSHVHKLGSSGDHLRIIYSGKDVWMLPSFPYDAPQRIYVKQDKTYIDKSIWGRDIYGDEVGLPYIRMKYSVPVHVISNKTFGSHEIQLIPTEGDVAICYIFFEDGVAE